MRSYLLWITIWTFLSTASKAQCIGETKSAPLGLNVSCPEADWKLVFEDEFEGTSVDTALWHTKYFNPAPADRVLYQNCKREHQVYLGENLEVRNGMLTIHARREAFTYAGIAEEDIVCKKDRSVIWREGEVFEEQFAYTSGAIASKPVFSPKDHLWLETSCKVPKGKGLWPAFWSWHHDEVDVFEYFDSSDDDHFSTDYHSFRGGHCVSSVKGNNLTEDFHTYAAEITPWFINWYFDGALVRTVARFYSILGQPMTVNCFQQLPAGFYAENTIFPQMENRWFGAILNLAINPKFEADEIAGLPAEMKIDYVRIYKRISDSTQVDKCKAQQDDWEVSVYPNPAFTQVTLTVENLSLNFCEFEIDVTDVQGQVLKQDRFIGPTYEMDVSGWQTGIYFVLVYYLDKVYASRLVIL